MPRGTVADLCRQASLASDNEFDRSVYEEAAERIEELEGAVEGILAPHLNQEEVREALTHLSNTLHKERKMDG